MDQHANAVCFVTLDVLGKKLSVPGQWIFRRAYR